MRVVVLGGTRFIGAAIVEELAAYGHELLLVHRGEHEPEGLPEADHLHAERRDLPHLRGALDDFRPEALVDTRALTAADAEIALAAVGDVRLLVLSSMDVYRAFGSLLAGTETDALPLDETSPVREQRYPYRGHPRYGREEWVDDYDKLDVEEAYLRRAATVCRLPMVYGERDYQRREEPILRRVRAGRPRIPTGAGTFLWTRGYVRDVAAGVRLALESEACIGEVLNLGERRSWSMALWARHVLEAAGAEAELTLVPDVLLPEDLQLFARMPQHVLVSSSKSDGVPAYSGFQHLLVDSSKARDLLGWEETDPHEALRRSVAWHLAHPPADASDDFSADDRALEAQVGGAL
jgi:nucleoside-diphosphate-sugar epimerase